MKALTLWQPWATLWALQLKLNETRSWATTYSGPLAIHAAKNTPLEEFRIIEREPFRQTVLEHHLIPFPRGCIIAVCENFRVRPALQALEELEEQGIPAFLETAFGDFSEGRFAWLPMNMQVLKKPIPCRGYQQLWTVPTDIVKQIEESVADKGTTRV